ncbi:unnamed protein product [Euphydryas editha]|uniref:Uncharacterized protein n=1 Tax=Euphydryas editha TaxID=104508 RepID=A0AAU9VCN7_EUPED|nr:unnamed protein product [Euphydryas editha]
MSYSNRSLTLWRCCDKACHTRGINERLWPAHGACALCITKGAIWTKNGHNLNISVALGRARVLSDALVFTNQLLAVEHLLSLDCFRECELMCVCVGPMAREPLPAPGAAANRGAPAAARAVSFFKSFALDFHPISRLDFLSYGR